MMLIVTEEASRQEIKNGRLVSLRFILREVPVVLRNGTISWLKIEGEERPSTLIIHTGISEEELLIFARARLTSIVRQKNLNKGLGFILFSNKEKARNDIEQAKKQAKESILVDSVPISPLIEEINDIQSVQAERPFVEQENTESNMRSSIIINRSIQEVFTYISDPSQFLQNTRTSEDNFKSYSLFGIPIITVNSSSLGFKSFRQSPPGPLQLGTRFFTDDNSTPSKATSLIAEYEPPHTITCEFGGSVIPSGKIKIVLTSNDSNSTTVFEDLQLQSGFYGFMWLLVAPILRKQMKTNMRRMKESLESSGE